MCTKEEQSVSSFLWGAMVGMVFIYSILTVLRQSLNYDNFFENASQIQTTVEACESIGGRVELSGIFGGVKVDACHVN